MGEGRQESRKLKQAVAGRCKGRSWQAATSAAAAAVSAVRYRLGYSNRPRTDGRMGWQIDCPVLPRVLVPGALQVGARGAGGDVVVSTWPPTAQRARVPTLIVPCHAAPDAMPCPHARVLRPGARTQRRRRPTQALSLPPSSVPAAHHLMQARTAVGRAAVPPPKE